MEILLKNQIAISALIGALFAAGGLLWEQPSFGATPDAQVAFSPDGGGERLVLKTIYGARQTIRVMAYSFTSPVIVRALLDAKRRGVDVAVTVDYRNNVEEDRSGKAAAALGALAYARIPVRVVRVFPMQHSKYAICDETVETGSYNFSQAAAHFNSENVLVLSNHPEIAHTYLENWNQVTAQGEDFRPR
jgi:phosphatidylserine/phosphatidylglycerophosphate/cardiolipin synthase-like enzyme